MSASSQREFWISVWGQHVLRMMLCGAPFGVELEVRWLLKEWHRLCLDFFCLTVRISFLRSVVKLIVLQVFCHCSVDFCAHSCTYSRSLPPNPAHSCSLLKLRLWKLHSSVCIVSQFIAAFRQQYNAMSNLLMDLIQNLLNIFWTSIVLWYNNCKLTSSYSISMDDTLAYINGRYTGLYQWMIHWPISMESSVFLCSHQCPRVCPEHMPEHARTQTYMYMPALLCSAVCELPAAWLAVPGLPATWLAVEYNRYCWFTKIKSAVSIILHSQSSSR